MKAKEFLFEAKRPKIEMPKQRDPNWRTMQAKATSGAGGTHKDQKRAVKQGNVKHKKDLIPMEDQGVAEAVDPGRRRILAGMIGLAARGIVPGSVVDVLTKELNTPAAAAGRLSTAAGLALFQVIRDQLNQYDGEDDDDYYQAWEDMAGDLGMDQDEDEFRDLMDLYHRDPKAAAQRLIQHLEQVGIDPNTIKVQPRDDWRYEWRIENGQRLVRNQDGDLEWVSPGDPDYPASKKDTSTSATQAAASAVGRGQATALTSAAVSRFRDLVQRVMSAGQTQQSPTKDMGRIEPVTPALPAPDKTAAEIMRDLQDIIDRTLTDDEKEVVRQEIRTAQNKGVAEGDKKPGWMLRQMRDKDPETYKKIADKQVGMAALRRPSKDKKGVSEGKISMNKKSQR